MKNYIVFIFHWLFVFFSVVFILQQLVIMELPVTTHLKEVKLYQHLKQILYLTWVKVPKATVKPPWATTLLFV